MITLIRTLTAIIAGMVLGSSLPLMGMADAHSATPRGCIAAHADPGGAVANECWMDGWTIQRRLVIDPHNIVRYSALPQCKWEDGSGPGVRCTWNVIRQEGGLSYVVNRDGRIRYVWPSDPRLSGERFITWRAAFRIRSDRSPWYLHGCVDQRLTATVNMLRCADAHVVLH